MRPKFHDQPYWGQRDRRTSESHAEMANAIHHQQPSPLSWLLADIFVALILVAVIVGLMIGVI